MIYQENSLEVDNKGQNKIIRFVCSSKKVSSYSEQSLRYWIQLHQRVNELYSRKVSTYSWEPNNAPN